MRKFLMVFAWVSFFASFGLLLWPPAFKLYPALSLVGVQSLIIIGILHLPFIQSVFTVYNHEGVRTHRVSFVGRRPVINALAPPAPARRGSH